MNAAKHLFRQTGLFRSTVRSLSNGRLLVTVSSKLPQSRILQPCIAQSNHIRLRSTAQPSKFEVINVQDEEDFKKRVLESSQPVVVDFHATWCGPCKVLGPRLEKIVSDANGKVVMAKIDIDENADLAMEYGVRSIPTVLCMKDGKVLYQFVGLIDEDKIQTFVDKLAIS